MSSDPAAEALLALTKVLGEAVKDAEEAGVGVQVLLGLGTVRAFPSPLVPAGEVIYGFDLDEGWSFDEDVDPEG